MSRRGEETKRGALKAEEIARGHKVKEAVKWIWMDEFSQEDSGQWAEQGSKDRTWGAVRVKEKTKEKKPMSQSKKDKEEQEGSGVMEAERRESFGEEGTV